MKLTDQQMNHFKSFGFLTFRQYLTPDELKTYSDEFDAALEARRLQLGGNVKRVWTTLMDANTPFIASLIDDPRLPTLQNRYSVEIRLASSPMETTMSAIPGGILTRVPASTEPQSS